ncbi:hypothetical protein BV25DRAFT_1736286 [Artomyces pyxidatus]|uniref:Uncharacterized protein n=1 Tax=Artomyces pyxidatus TaxID=48021 RepID=A0ACB8SHA6_9AGAM|nr:hypothetical protein BV25DRAFT_1736286 [Artomyces pyxidatus]
MSKGTRPVQTQNVEAALSRSPPQGQGTKECSPVAPHLIHRVSAPPQRESPDVVPARELERLVSTSSICSTYLQRPSIFHSTKDSPKREKQGLLQMQTIGIALA